TTGVLLPTEGPTDLRTRGTDVDIDDPTVRTGRGQESLRLTLILGEDRRGQPLGHTVVQLHRLRQGPVGDHVQDRCKGLLLYHLVLSEHAHHLRLHVIGIGSLTHHAPLTAGQDLHTVGFGPLHRRTQRLVPAVTLPRTHLGRFIVG